MRRPTTSEVTTIIGSIITPEALVAVSQSNSRIGRFLRDKTVDNTVDNTIGFANTPIEGVHRDDEFIDRAWQYRKELEECDEKYGGGRN